MHVLLDERSPREAVLDRTRLVRWLDSVLREGAEISVGDDLPLLFEECDAVARRVLVVDGNIAAHAAARMLDVRTPACTLRVAVIGAVGTDPKKRRRGLGSLVINSLLDELRGRGIPLAVLWADVPDFYERLGFVTAGRESIFVCPKACWPGPRRMMIRPAAAADLPAIRELHRREACRVRRSERTWQTLFKLPRTSFYLVERRRRILAYGVVGKGHDLGGCLHEWGGDETLLPVLVSGIFQLRSERELYVMNPPWKVQAARAMAFHRAAPNSGALAMFRVLNRRVLLEGLGLAERDDLPERDDDLLRAVLGDPATPSGTKDGLPVPFYLSGLDSM